MSRRPGHRHFKTCIRCNNHYITSARTSKVCKKCRLPVGNSGGSSISHWNLYLKKIKEEIIP